MSSKRRRHNWAAVDWRLTNKEIAMKLGTWANTVSMKRKEFGGGVTPPAIDYDALDWSKNNKDLARELRMHSTSLSMIRKRLGKPPAPRGPKKGHVGLRHTKKCRICGDTFEVRPSSSQATCRKKECVSDQKKGTRAGATLSGATRKKIGDGVRHGKSNKIAWATRWSPESEKLMRDHTEKTGESRVATLERLVRENL